MEDKEEDIKTYLSVLQTNMKEHEYIGLRTFTDAYPSIGYNVLKVVDLTLGIVIELNYDFDLLDDISEQNPEIIISNINFNTCDEFGMCAFPAGYNHHNKMEPAQVKESIKMHDNLFKGIFKYTKGKNNGIEGGVMFG